MVLKFTVLLTSSPSSHLWNPFHYDWQGHMNLPIISLQTAYSFSAWEKSENWTEISSLLACSFFPTPHQGAFTQTKQEVYPNYVVFDWLCVQSFKTEQQFIIDTSFISLELLYQ